MLGQAFNLDRLASASEDGVMFRAAILIPVLITSLLACPLKCMGAMQESSLPAADCCCCHDACRDRAEADLGASESRQNSSAPVSSTPANDLPADDCTCPSCLCNGALIGADEAAVDLEPLCESFCAAASAVASASASVACAESATVSAVAVPLYVTGRSVRIAHQSFLL